MAIILDIAVILVLAFSIMSSYKSGLIKIICRIIANVFAFFIAISIAKYISNFIYDNFVRDFLMQKVNDFTFTQFDIDTLKNTMLQLPQFVHSALSTIGINVNEIIYALDKGVVDFGTFLADNLLRPIMVLFISNILVVVIYIVLTPLIKLILNKLHIINKVPFLGTVNKYAGALGGVLIGIIDWLFMSYIVNIFIIITTDGSPYLNSSIMQATHIFKLIYNIGLF